MEPVALTVVVPAHNSGPLIDATVQRLAERLGDRRAEIIVVENGSNDDTLSRCELLAAAWTGTRVTFRALQADPGMGYALRAGVVSSQGRHVLLTADDLPFGFDDIDAADRMLGESGRLPALIIGSKAHPASRAMRGAGRGVLTRGFGAMRRLILGSRVGDSQGTLLVDGELVRRLAPHLSETGFLFSTELVYLIERLGFVPVEVPVTLDPQHAQHESRIRLTDVARMAFGLLRLRWRHRGLRLAKIAPSQPPAA